MKTLIKLPQEQFDLVKEQFYLGLHCRTRPNLSVQMIEILQVTEYNTKKGSASRCKLQWPKATSWTGRIQFHQDTPEESYYWRNLGRVSAMDQTKEHQEDGHPTQTFQSFTPLKQHVWLILKYHQTVSKILNLIARGVVGYIHIPKNIHRQSQWMCPTNIIRNNNIWIRYWYPCKVFKIYKIPKSLGQPGP